MARFVCTLVVLAAVVVACGFYLHWFDLSTANHDNHVNVNISIDKAKLIQDTEIAAQKVKELGGKFKATAERLKDGEHARGDATSATAWDADKAAYQAKVEAELKTYDDRSDELRSRAEREGLNTRVRLNGMMAAVQLKAQAARQKLDELKRASAEKWHSARPEVETALNDLRKEWDEVIASK